MGTNYYWIKDACSHCNRGSSSVHIGKSSAGWTFHFKGYRSDDWNGGPEIASWKDWRVILEGQRIEDEYGHVVTLPELEELINGKRDGINFARIALRKDLTERDRSYMEDHPRDLLVQGYRSEGEWLDHEGNAFSDSEFS